MVTERLSNVSLGLAVLLSFVVVALCFSFFATMNNPHSGDLNDSDLSIKKAGHISPVLNGS